jgi:CRISPR-associated protein Cas2
MVVIATTAVPDHLRGALGRWTSEVVPGIFVGSVSTRVRDELWHTVTEVMSNGAAVLLHLAPPNRAMPSTPQEPAAGCLSTSTALP